MVTTVAAPAAPGWRRRGSPQLAGAARRHRGRGAVPGRGGGQARRRNPGRADGHVLRPRGARRRLPHLPGRPGRGGGRAAGWQPGPASAIGNHAIENEAVHGDRRPGQGRHADQHPAAGGTELLAAAPATSWSLQPEHARHPRWGEGPWLLCPARAGRGLGPGPARVRAERCPVGPRLVGAAELGGLHRDQETLLWDGADRGRVPHPRGRLDRPGPAAAGGVPGRRAGRAAGLPDRGLGDRAAAGPGRHRRGGARVHAGQPSPASGSASARRPGSRWAAAPARRSCQAIGVAEVVTPPCRRRAG